MINNEVSNSNWKPILAGKKGLQIFHLFFADDMLLFAEASMSQINLITGCLEEFCLMSSQKVSVNKTKILFSKNIENGLAKNICDRSGFSKCNNLGRYLGILLLQNRISFSTYSYLLEKIQDRLAGWKAESLSMAGRVTLCKSVISALPIYIMQSTLLPKSICKDIEKLCRNFVWGDSESHKKIHLVNWQQLCQPLSNGGFGLKNMKAMNDALLLKLAWGLIADKDSLWVHFLKDKYKAGKDLMPFVWPKQKGKMDIRQWESS